MYNLAMMQLGGQGTPRDCSRALPFLKQARAPGAALRRRSSMPPVRTGRSPQLGAPPSRRPAPRMPLSHPAPCLPPGANASQVSERGLVAAGAVQGGHDAFFRGHYTQARGRGARWAAGMVTAC